MAHKSHLTPQNPLHIPLTSSSNILPGLVNFISKMPPYFHHHVHRSTLRPMSCLDHCSSLTAGAPASTLCLATIYPIL